MKLYLISTTAIFLLVACSSPESHDDAKRTDSAPKAGANMANAAAAEESDTKTAVATGVIAETKVDRKRFWISFDGSKNAWMGGHTPPATDILPVTSGKFVIGAQGLVLRTNDGKRIGELKAFFGHTAVGQTGEGTIDTSAELFRWTAI